MGYILQFILWEKLSFVKNSFWRHFQRSLTVTHGNRPLWTRRQFKEIPTSNSSFYLSSASDMLPQDNFFLWIHSQVEYQTQDGQSAKRSKEKTFSEMQMWGYFGIFCIVEFEMLLTCFYFWKMLTQFFKEGHRLNLSKSWSDFLLTMLP